MTVNKHNLVLLSLIFLVSAISGPPVLAEGPTKTAAKPGSKLTSEQIWKSKFLIDRHPVYLKDGYSQQGITRAKTVEADEDDNFYWTIEPHNDTEFFCDLDGDGKGDAAFLAVCNHDLHFVVMLNKDGRPKQICDFIVDRQSAMLEPVKFEFGQLVVSWQPWNAQHPKLCKFKLKDGQCLRIDPPASSAAGRGLKIENVPLTTNPRDLLHPIFPKRIPEIISRVPVLTGLRVTKLSKKIVDSALKKLKKQMDLVDDTNGYGKIENIAFGDLNGDGQQDAAVIFGISHADNTELRLIPAVVDHGFLTFVGSVRLGGEGFDTLGKTVEVKSGIIRVAVETYDKTAVQQVKHPWVSMRFKTYQGKRLIKLK